jgi:putative nucleotidyltransferase with HDIG domain
VRQHCHLQILRDLDDPNLSSEEIAQAINQDMGLTAFVLRTANAVLFSPSSSRISSLSEAVTAVGTTQLKTMIFSARDFHFIDEAKTVPGFDSKTEWEHALKVATTAQELAREACCSYGVQDEALVAGLLHDLGKILMAVGVPDVYALITEKAEKNNLPRWRVEQDLLGFNHAELGAEVLKNWGLAPKIIDAIRWHHNPDASRPYSINPLLLVHLADCQCREIEPAACCVTKFYGEKEKESVSVAA